MKKLRRGSRGTALLESIMACAALVTLISGGLGVAYFCFAKVWLDRSSYETLICLSSRETVADCDQRMRDDVHHGLSIGELKDLRLQRSRNQASISYRFEVNGKTIVRAENSLRLPLSRQGAKP